MRSTAEVAPDLGGVSGGSGVPGGSSRGSAAPGGSEMFACVRSARAQLTAAATGPELADLDNADRVDLLRELEEVAASVAAVQARLAADLDASIRADRAQAGVPAEQQGAGVASQVALARRVSPVRGSQYLGMGKALANEMPHTMAALAGGALSEWRATLLVRESACLSVEDRAAFDAELCADPDRFAGWGDRRLVAEARSLTTQLDQAALVRRAAKAEAERRVTIRPAPDVMAQVGALVPVAQGAAVHAALTRRADELRAQGDTRTKAQLMADTLVERVTGQSRADAVPVQVQVVMSDRALLDGADSPAYVDQYGVVPSRWARELIARAGDQGAAARNGHEGRGERKRLGVWVRRLFTRPETGELVAMQARARRAPAGLAAFIRARDRTCRTPWCDAPIRHIDHINEHAAGGPTSEPNLQGLCEACNYAKTAPGWSAQAERAPQAEHRLRVGRREGADRGDDDSSSVAACSGHRVRTMTPTGHGYLSPAPGVLGASGAAGGPWWRREHEESGLVVARERGPTARHGHESVPRRARGPSGRTGADGVPPDAGDAPWTAADQRAAAYARELDEAFAGASQPAAMGQVPTPRMAA